MDRRRFIALSSACAALGAGSAFAETRLAANVERLAPQRLRLAWAGASGPVRVLASSDPDAPASLMRVLAETANEAFEVDLAASPRPYFLVEAEGAATRAAERLLPLQGGRNFRDLGGYVGAEGRQVRWGRIYRSGVTSGLTAQDLTYLAELGIETVCDFRSTTERAREPSAFKAESGVNLAALDYELDYSGMAGVLSATSRDEAITAFAASYATFATTLAPQLSDMFQRLIRRETPLAFNCTAGKDRTGLAAALLLSALGVPRDVVVADYALSERFVPVETYLSAIRGDGAASSSMGEAERRLFSRMPDEVARVLLGTPAGVMEQTLARFDAEYGGPVGFITGPLGISAGQVAYLRSVYLA